MNLDPWMMDVTAEGRMVPAWLVLPFAGATVLLVVWHLRRLSRASMPESRRRIRGATGLLTLLLVPLMTYALSVTSPRAPVVFVMAWLAVVVLVLLLVVLAMADIGNTLRLHRTQTRRLRREMGEMTRRLRTAARSSPDPSPHESAPAPRS